MGLHTGPPGQPWYQPPSSTAQNARRGVQMGARARRRLKRAIVQPTRQGSLNLGIVSGLVLEFGGVVVGWAFLRWMGWV